MATTSLGFDNFINTTLSSDINDTDTDIPLDSVPTASEGFLVIEPSSADNREVIYYTSKTSIKVVCPSGAGNGRGYDGTTGVSHSAGVQVISAPVAAMFEALQDGSAISAGAITPNKLLASTGTTWAWQNFTPSFTNWTIGTGGSAGTTAKYIQIGKTVFYRITTTLGTSGQSVGSNVTFQLPVAAVSGLLGADNIFPVGEVHLQDAGTASYWGSARINNADLRTAQILVNNTSTTYQTGGALSSTIPHTWAAGDSLTIRGFYEAA